MAALKCALCGGKLIGRPGGIYECEFCGVDYDSTWAKARLRQLQEEKPSEEIVDIQISLRQMFDLLEAGDWDGANAICDKILQNEQDNVQAYIGKLMAQLRVKHQEDLKERSTPFDDNAYYQKIIALADENVKKTFEGYLAYIRYYVENLQQREVYEKAKGVLDLKNLTEKEYLTAAKMFDSVRSYRDAGALAEDCYKKADREHLESVRLMALARKRRRRVFVGIFLLSIAVSLVVYLFVIPYSKYKDAVKMMEAGQYEDAIKAFERLNDQLSCQDDILECRYRMATDFGKQGRYGEAAILFGQLNDYKDAFGKAKQYWRKATVREIVSAGDMCTAGLLSDGTVMAAGIDSAELGKWSEIVAVSAGRDYVAGLQSDGTVVSTEKMPYGLYGNNYVAISAGPDYIVGLKIDGTLQETGASWAEEIENWTDIVSVCAGTDHIVALKSDGTVLEVGRSSTDGISKVTTWKNIKAISISGDHAVGLTTDGTVVAVGLNNDGQCNVGRWTDVVAISAGADFTVGLLSDGTAISVGANREGQRSVSGWSDLQMP